MSDVTPQPDATPIERRSIPVVNVWIAAAVGLVLLVGGFVLGRTTANEGGSVASVTTVDAREDAATLLQVALQLHRDGDLSAAEAAYLRVLELAPSDQFALYNLGQINQTRNELDVARGFYDRALVIDPNMVSALYNRGLALRDLGEIEAAIVDLRKLLELEPENARGLFNLGNILIADGEVEEGTAMVARAIELEPTLRGDV